ncbi:MAG: hypothetical protein HY748_09810 [Elusimicrobia bacterium]|nr:hypothetical protein [Elusimicrobiota bacterium]
MKAVLLFVLSFASVVAPGLAAPAAKAQAAPYAIEDEGGFFPTGQRVEFHDRYGWQSYRVRFEFGLESGGRSLTKDSRLSVRILKRDGDVWEHSCRAKGRDALAANVNGIPGEAVSVVVECRIPEREFAKAVDLDPLDVGIPNLVFHVILRDGALRLGAQRGLYITPTVESATSELSAYASVEHSPSNPSVIFSSN